MSERRYLFVCGIGRSGTTALTQLLNCHPEIALGIERYKRLYNDAGDIGPALFEPGRFFRWSEAETNIDPAIVGDQAAFAEKLATARYVGDKFPHLINRTELLDRRFPQPLVLAIFRDPYRVAASWKARAENADDRWNPARDEYAAVGRINRFVETAIELHRERPERFALVEYERVFDPTDPRPLNNLMAWLALDAHPDLLAAWRANGATFQAAQAKVAYEIDVDHVRSTIKWQRFEELRKIAK